MDTLPALLVLVAALAHATWNAMLKGRRGDPLAASTALCLGWVVVTLPTLFFVDAPAPAAWPHLVASTVLHVVYFAALVASYRLADLSLVYPIARGVPPLIVALGGATWLGERPPPLALVGVGLVAVGVLALGFARSTAPAESRRKDEARALALAFVTALLIASYTLVDGAGARAAGTPFGYAAWLFVAEGTLFGVGAYALSSPRTRREVRARWREGFAAGTLAAGGYAVALWAMTVAPIALVASLRETSVVIAAILGAVFLKEPFGGRRLVAAIVVAGGVIAIQLGSR